MTETPAAHKRQPRLLFVYNADHGFLNAVRDVWQRVTRPSSYPCSLCKVTYGAGGMDKRWRSCVEGLDVDTLMAGVDEGLGMQADMPDWTRHRC